MQLISPFVGRIYDWYKKSRRRAVGRGRAAPAPTTPACSRCAQIYNYYKHFGIATEVMGASFRNVGQIRALAGCDLLTISPELLAELQASDAPLPRALDADAAQGAGHPRRAATTRRSFRFALNEDAMATEKLAEGIRAFAADAVKLEQADRGRLNATHRAPAATARAPGRSCSSHYDSTGRDFDLRDAFAQRPAAASTRFSQQAPHVFADLSKNLHRRRDASAAARRWRANAGWRRTATRCSPASRINTTEGRAVLHSLLRAPRGATRPTPDCDGQVHETLDAMLAYAEQRARRRTRITDVVNIGIGGSDLGPQMAVPALDAFATPGKRFHFVSNVDGHDLAPVLRKLRAREARCSSIASQDLHHAGDDGQRAARRRRWFEHAGRHATSRGTSPR